MCDSMNILMKKLDHLNEEIQEAQSANSSYGDEADVDKERQSTAVRHKHKETTSSNNKLTFMVSEWSL